MLPCHTFGENSSLMSLWKCTKILVRVLSCRRCHPGTSQPMHPAPVESGLLVLSANIRTCYGPKDGQNYSILKNLSFINWWIFYCGAVVMCGLGGTPKQIIDFHLCHGHGMPMYSCAVLPWQQRLVPRAANMLRHILSLAGCVSCMQNTLRTRVAGLFGLASDRHRYDVIMSNLCRSGVGPGGFASRGGRLHVHTGLAKYGARCGF